MKFNPNIITAFCCVDAIVTSWTRRYHLRKKRYRGLTMFYRHFCKQHHESKDKLTIQRTSTSTRPNERCYFTLQNETLS